VTGSSGGVEGGRDGDADLDLATAEGEGFRSVDEWREPHEDFRVVT
jgi:uncharacterized protein YhfF